MSIKYKLFLPVILSAFAVSFVSPTPAYAVVQTLNSQTGQDQTFQNDSNVTVSSSNNVHSIIWQGLLPISRGGTGASAFTNGSIPFISSGIFSENNSNLYWDNTNGRLGIGTNSPSNTLDVNGNAKVTSLTATNDSTISGLTIGKGGGSVSSNTAMGVEALLDNTAGVYNTGVGAYALWKNTYGVGNTAIGNAALAYLVAASGNTAVGSAALTNNTSENNTAVGSGALTNNTSGSLNSGLGQGVLSSNTTGGANTAIGAQALPANTSGNNNVAIGYAALDSSMTGSNNIAIGQAAFLYLTGGNSNIAVGQDAARWQADGSTHLTSAANSVYLGTSVRGYDNNDSNSIVIGTSAIGAGANKTVIGNSSMTDVYFGSSSANANTHAKKMYLGDSSTPGCIIMGDSDGSGVTYLTVNDGVLSVSSTQPSACQ